MRKRNIIMVAIFFMVVGFATISTTLFINGSSTISNKTEDFDVYFSDAYIDKIQSLEAISKDKKTITFETSSLINKNEKSILEYEVTNASHQYDAGVSINCVPEENDLIKIETTIEKDVIEARSKVNGQVMVRLKEDSSGENRIEFSCTLQVSAIERGSLVDKDIPLGITPGTVWEFDFSGEEEKFTVPLSGNYKLELWGAQGGSNTYIDGGYGGYSTAVVFLNIDKPIYINVGGQGLSSEDYSPVVEGGYNGGGNAYSIVGSCNNFAGSGGGATHIAFSSGVLKDLKDDINSIIIVAGAGGGACYRQCSLSDSTASFGGSAGGSDSNVYQVITTWPYQRSTGGTQTIGGDPGAANYYSESGGLQGGFGQGGSTNRTGGYTNSAGGGGGFYGGGSGMFIGGGGGSGYIGNPILTNKNMACYECTPSNEESTKTISVTDVSEEPEENQAKKGNGHVKITYLGK